MQANIMLGMNITQISSSTIARFSPTKRALGWKVNRSSGTSRGAIYSRILLSSRVNGISMQKRIYSSSLEAVLYTTRAVISDGGLFGSILSGSRCLLQTPSVLHDASKIKKCLDSLYNKADTLTMNIGREVIIGKVPNPNTGIQHHQLVYWY